MDPREIADNLTHKIFDSCCKSFLEPTKKKKRKSNWMPKHIIKAIKLRTYYTRRVKDLKKELHSGHHNAALIKYTKVLLRSQKEKVKNLINEHKINTASRV